MAHGKPGAFDCRARLCVLALPDKRQCVQHLA